MGFKPRVGGRPPNRGSGWSRPRGAIEDLDADSRSVVEDLMHQARHHANALAPGRGVHLRDGEDLAARLRLETSEEERRRAARLWLEHRHLFAVVPLPAVADALLSALAAQHAAALDADDPERLAFEIAEPLLTSGALAELLGTSAANIRKRRQRWRDTRRQMSQDESFDSLDTDEERW